jgi:hypothetical protein
MQTQQSAAFTAIPILTLKDLGFEGTVSLDQASRGLAERSEAQIIRWVQFPAGALFFVLVPGDPKSGALYVSTGGAACSTPSISTTRTGAATVWPSTTCWNEHTGFPDSLSGPGCSTGSVNRERPADQWPDPFPFARVLDSGYQKAGRKEEPP